MNLIYLLILFLFFIFYFFPHPLCFFRSASCSDLLIAHVNFAAVIEWLALILIFYPRKGFVGTGAGGTSFNTNIASSNIISTSQISNANQKLYNVPPGAGAGIVIPYSQNSSTTSFGNNNNNEKRPQIQKSSSDSYQ